MLRFLMPELNTYVLIENYNVVNIFLILDWLTRCIKLYTSTVFKVKSSIKICYKTSKNVKYRVSIRILEKKLIKL